MDKLNWVIANIPVRKGLEERYGAHVNVASEREREREQFECLSASIMETNVNVKYLSYHTGQHGH